VYKVHPKEEHLMLAAAVLATAPGNQANAANTNAAGTENTINSQLAADGDIHPIPRHGKPKPDGDGRTVP
jgi:hypothetical protein